MVGTKANPNMYGWPFNVLSLTKFAKGAGPESLVGNKGFRKYVKIEKGSTNIDENRIKYEARFDGKWVLRTNTEISADQVSLKYKELWRVEKVFRDAKSLLTTRPIFHQKDQTIRGHAFCGKAFQAVGVAMPPTIQDA